MHVVGSNSKFCRDVFGYLDAKKVEKYTEFCVNYCLLKLVEFKTENTKQELKKTKKEHFICIFVTFIYGIIPSFLQYTFILVYLFSPMPISQN